MTIFKYDKLALGSFGFLVLIGLVALSAPLWVKEESIKMDFSLRLSPPSREHWFGAGPLGRDLFSRSFLALRTSLFTAFVIMLSSAAFGTTLGILAGYLGGRVDAIIMQLIGLAMAFPYLLLALLVAFTLGPGMLNMLLVLAAKRWVSFARIVRAETMRQRQGRGYLVAAEMVGGTRFWIIRKHLLPNLLPIISVVAVTGIPGVILSEATLSFLGLGIQPPQASLGLLVAQGKEYLTYATWLALIPGLILSLVCFSFYSLSNWLVIALDPVQKGRLK